MAVPVTLNLNKGRIEFNGRMPRIDRKDEFQLQVGNWDKSVEKVKLSNFRSLVFDHFQEGFVAGKDGLNIEIEIDTNPSNSVGYDLKNAGPHKFPFKNDVSRVPPLKHRLIEYDLEIETKKGDTIVVDPPWDEKP